METFLTPFKIALGLVLGYVGAIILIVLAIVLCIGIIFFFLKIADTVHHWRARRRRIASNRALAAKRNDSILRG